ncbi:hypothetical protein GW537_18980 (plasmid) [Piscirickettsia salmonis]|uniref:Transposase n=1 Tax=Piscirickettsia salmonis TaxID=1238 RepID=A0AAC8ZQ47_PISSA|nr:transposase [Piscirickettsia salmonis]QHS27594.1 hypothetical protein GW538_17060 [Piscirickettsia salmonis]QHS30799.1 hypothetical protein GW537_17205 [Piscirickettsia salmonis]QHS31080.1 hypothetical protein GW537_18980 [Piscirickettsia salmonis]
MARRKRFKKNQPFKWKHYSGEIILALLRKIIVSFRKVIFLCSLLRIKQLIQIIYQ